ncbi:MAG: hypothetical protein R6U17_09310 [Thermoplasmata archaeon]
MSKRFANRNSDLEYLEERYSLGQVELLVIYHCALILAMGFDGMKANYPYSNP